MAPATLAALAVPTVPFIPVERSEAQRSEASQFFLFGRPTDYALSERCMLSSETGWEGMGGNKFLVFTSFFPVAISDFLQFLNWMEWK